VDAAAEGFFFGTLQTLETAFVRLRFDNFVRFFEAAGVQNNCCLHGALQDAELVQWLNAHYAAFQRISARRIA